MKEYEFTLVLTSPEVSEEDANRLYEAGCSDGSISTSEGVTRIGFDREAASLEQAIRSAIENVQAAGFAVAQVHLEPQSLAEPRKARQPHGANRRLTIVQDDATHPNDFKEYMP